MSDTSAPCPTDATTSRTRRERRPKHVEPDVENSTTVPRINVDELDDYYPSGAPKKSELAKWERLLIVRFWEPARERPRTCQQPTTWSVDPPAWQPREQPLPADAAESDKHAAGALHLARVNAINDKIEEASRRAADYVAMIVNRQLSKVSGLLSLSSVLLAVFAFARTLGKTAWTCADNYVGAFALIGSWAAIASIAFLVQILGVGWSSPMDASSHRANLRFSLRVACARTRSITWAVRASTLALCCGAIVISLAIGRHLIAPAWSHSLGALFCSAR